MAKARVSPRTESKKPKPHGRQSVLESEICVHAPSRAKDTKRQFQVVGTLFYHISEVLEQVIKLKVRDAFKVDDHYKNQMASILANTGTYQKVRKAIDLLWEANDTLVDAARGLGAANIYRVRRERTPVAYPRKIRQVAVCFQSSESADQPNVVPILPVENPAASIPIQGGENHEKATASA